MLSYINIPHYLTLLLVNIFIAVILLIGSKLLLSLSTNSNIGSELSKHKNTAFGISLAGIFFAVTLVLTGAITGQAQNSILAEILWVSCYGISGLLLMLLSRYVFDKISMPNFAMQQQIRQGNLACGILDAGNLIATAIIIRAVMLWIEDDSILGFAWLVASYILSQLLLSLISMWRLFLYNRHHKSSMQEALQEGNIAIAWRFIGFRIAIAIAITVATALIPYAQFDWLTTLSAWLFISILVIIFVCSITWVLEKILLWSIDTRNQVDTQANTAVALIQVSIAIAVGLMVTAAVA